MNIRTGLRRLLAAGALGLAAVSAWAGPAEWLALTDEFGNQYQQTLSGEQSGRLNVRLIDDFGLAGTTTTSVPVEIKVFRSTDFAQVPFDMTFTDGATFFANVSSFSVIVGSGASNSPPFRIRLNTENVYQVQAYVANFLGMGDRSTYVTLEVLPTDTGFTGVNLLTDSQPPETTGQTSVTISPDNDGSNDAAVIEATPPGGGQWEVLFSRVDFSTNAPGAYSTIVERFFLYGQNSFYWYGTDQQNRRVRNGTYYARLQTPGGGIVDDTLEVVVQSPFIEGKVLDQSSAPVQGANVQVWGPGGGGNDMTKADGSFFVGGLDEGQTYTVNIEKPGFAGDQRPDITASQDIGNVFLQPGALLFVNVAVSQAPDHNLHGSVFGRTADYSDTVWGPLRVASGSAISDNGIFPTPSSWTVLGLLPNTAYKVFAELPEFGRIELDTTTVTGGTTYYWTPTLVRKANIIGQIAVSTPVFTPYNGEWISVDATLSGDSFPSFWGGGVISNYATSSTYRINGVSTGTYTLRMYARGYASASTTTIVTSTVDVTADLPTLNEGGSITGTINIIGDSSSVEESQFFGAGCQTAGQIPIYVNAHSPETYFGSFAQVCYATGPASGSVGFTMKGLDDGVYELHSYLPGFQIEPPGRNLVTVSGGAGSGSITFRRLSGTLNLSATIPNGDAGTSIHYRLDPRGHYDGGSQPPEGYLDSNAQRTLSGLGTGLFEVVFTNENPGRGLQKRVPVAVINGQTASVTADLTEATYVISGTVEVQGNITLSSPWNVTVSSVAGLNTVFSSATTVLVKSLSRDADISVTTPAAPSGAFSISGFPSGGYRVSVLQDLNFDQNCTACGSGGFPTNSPELSSSEAEVFVEGADESGVTVTIQNGVQVSGTVSRPSDDTDTTARTLMVMLFPSDSRNFDNNQPGIWISSVGLSGLSADYAFNHIGEGDYILRIEDRGDPKKYAVADTAISVGAGDVDQDIALLQAGTIVGRIRDADSETLLTQQNAGSILPDGFRISAQANPWVPGGYAEAERGNNGTPEFDSSSQFTIGGLLPDTNYDVTLSGNQLSPEMVARGQKAYAPAVVSGVLVAAGQTVDLGIIDIKQGVGITGTVTDTAGTPLSNIQVIGIPALLSGDNRHDYVVNAFTDKDGGYALQGVDPEQRYYDVIAAPRFEGGDIMSRLGGAKYGEETAQMIDVTDPDTRVGVDFALTEANASLSGRVVTEDGGGLYAPFSEARGERVGMVFLHLEGEPFDDNPLGEVQEPTDTNGNFNITGLKPGTYSVRVVSVGYATSKKIVVVSAGANDAGTIELEKGATVGGTVTKPDGSAPNTEEVKFLVGVDEDFEEFVFGPPETDASDQVSGYSMTGFKTGIDYSIIIITGNDDLLLARSGLRFSSKDEEKTVNLIYRPSPPSVYATQTRVGDRFTLRFFSTHKFRNITDDDNDVSKIIKLTQGGGSIVSRDLSSSRDLVTVVYDKAANEKTFRFQLEFDSIQVDLDDPEGDNFHFLQEFKFFAGAKRMRVIRIPNALGGNVRMEGDNAASGFVSGTFDGDNIGSSSNIEVGILSAEDLDDLSESAPRPARRARGVAAVAKRLGPEAYPSLAMYKAVQAAPSVSPFSAFYDVFLPAGVSHSFKKEALLTLAYDATVTDPTEINVYYFDPNNDVFLLESTKRKIDTKNKTITVAVNHASTFVVLNNNAPIVGANTYAGTEITVHNFPNPFNLKSKTVSRANDSSNPTATVTGTQIRYALPAGKAGAVKIDIYNVAGELVRTISQTAATGGAYFYTEWDGKNDGGKNVASGAYIARFTLNDGDEQFFKMAVVK